MGVGPIGFSVEQQNLMWAMRRGGESFRELERTLGETNAPDRRFLRQSGGFAPIYRQRRADHLTLTDVRRSHVGLLLLCRRGRSPDASIRRRRRSGPIDFVQRLTR